MQELTQPRYGRRLPRTQRGSASARALWHPMLLVGLLTVGGGAVRFLTLGLQSFWGDELFTVWLVRMNFGQMVSTIPRTEETPYLYYVIAWIWSRLFGSGEVGLRSLSALFGTLLIPVAALLGREIAGSVAAVIAAALVACNPFLFWYSQEARSYALLALVSALSLFFFLRARSGRTSDFVLWAATSALALLTHYFAVFPVAVEAVWLLANPYRRRARVVAVATVAACGAAIAPLALHQEQSGHSAWIAGTSLPHRVLQIPKEFLAGYDVVDEKFLTAAAVVVAIFGLFQFCRVILVRSPRRREALQAAVVTAAAILLPVALAVAGLDFVVGKNFLAALAPALAILAAGFSTSRWGYGAAGVLCAVFLIVVVAIETMPNYQREDWRAVGAALRTELPGSGPPGPRVFVSYMHPGYLLEPYIPGLSSLPSTGARVREIDVAAAVSEGTVVGATPVPPRPRVLLSPPRGFRIAARIETSTYTLIRYVAPTPELVVPSEARRLALDVDPFPMVERSPR